MRLIHSLPWLFCLLSTALADVQFTVPVPGTVMKAGDVVTAHWTDSGDLPRISELAQYDLYLCAGGDSPDAYEEVALLVKDVTFARGNSVSFKIDPGVGGNEPSSYFLKMVASGPETFMVNYSGRFTLTGMTGSFSPMLENDIHPITGENRHREDLRKRQAAGLYTVPFQLQTGPTRYAPMAKKPGSTIPAKSSPTPQFPTSAYDIATAYLSAPTIQATVSATQVHFVVSVENTASPAPHPHDAQMKRFLERWKD